MPSIVVCSVVARLNLPGQAIIIITKNVLGASGHNHTVGYSGMS